MNDQPNYIDPYGPEAEAMKERALAFYADNVASEGNGFVSGINAIARHEQPNPSGIYPTEFKTLVLPDPTEEKSKGGIIIPTELVDKNKFATTEGTLIAASPLAFTYASEAEWDGNKPMPGDRIIYERYAGGSTHVKGKDGVEYILVNDRSIFAKAEF